MCQRKDKPIKSKFLTIEKYAEVCVKISNLNYENYLNG